MLCIRRAILVSCAVAALVWSNGRDSSAIEPAPAAPKESAKEVKPADAKPSEKPAEKAADRYAVPTTGDTTALLTFIADLQRFRPRTREEYIDHIDRMPPAITKAAERILELEKDANSDAAKTAKMLILDMRVRSIISVSPAEQKTILAEVAKIITAKGADIGGEEARLGHMTAQRLEASGNTELAVEAYTTLATALKKAKDKELADAATAFDPVIRRLKLPGNVMEITGKTLDGKPFDWAAYRGKVVLVDYWATWCGPCVAELPNVKENYKKYHAKGFDVVGISLDEDRKALVDFIAKEETPWVQLFEDGAGWKHSMAKQYGVQSIPCVILVDKEGKVVSLRARGPELGKLLAKLLGPADPKADAETKEKPVVPAPAAK